MEKYKGVFIIRKIKVKLISSFKSISIDKVSFLTIFYLFYLKEPFCIIVKN